MNRLYAFLYDDFLSASSYQKVLANIETRCSVLGIQGRVSRLAIFRSARELVENLVADGAETIVVVGNDVTLQKIMWFLPDLPVTIGYIPVAEPFGIATMLGIPPGEAACDILAARRMETLDLGRLDKRYFFTEVLIRDTKARVSVDGRFTVSATHAGTISIRNLGSISMNGGSKANAKDGWLELAVEPILPSERRSRFSFFHPPKRGKETNLKLKEGTIESAEPIDLLMDGHQVNGFRFTLGVIPNKLKIITGRNKLLSLVPGGILPASPKRGIVSATRDGLHKAASWWTRQRMYF
jgi:diacylglycerol kinase family enzyme